jgi:hypothetical protein
MVVTPPFRNGHGPTDPRSAEKLFRAISRRGDDIRLICDHRLICNHRLYQTSDYLIDNGLMSYRTRWTILMTIGGLAAAAAIWAITGNVWWAVVGLLSLGWCSTQSSIQRVAASDSGCIRLPAVRVMVSTKACESVCERRYGS